MLDLNSIISYTKLTYLNSQNSINIDYYARFFLSSGDTKFTKSL